MRLCSPHCGLAPESGSGGEVYERELLRSLAIDHGVDCDILLAHGKPHPENVPNWTIHPVWPPKGLRWYVTPLVWPQAIKRAWDRHPCDLLRAHSVRFAGPACLWARQRYHLPVPVVTHHHHLDPSPLNRVIERRVIEASDLVITDSEFAKRQLERELGVRTDHVRVVYCGVKTDGPVADVDDLRRRYGLTGRRLLLSLGPLVGRKRPRLMVEMFAKIHREEPKAILVWIGRGSQQAELEALVARLGLSRSVVFTGFVSDGVKRAFLTLADVFVFPSQLEGFALAPQEAMAAGVPVVAFRVASMPEMIEDDRSGFLVDDGWQETFVARVLQLLRDGALRIRLGAAGATRLAQRFTWDRTVRNVLHAYEDAIRARCR